MWENSAPFLLNGVSFRILPKRSTVTPEYHGDPCCNILLGTALYTRHKVVIDEKRWDRVREWDETGGVRIYKTVMEMLRWCWGMQRMKRRKDEEREKCTLSIYVYLHVIDFIRRTPYEEKKMFQIDTMRCLAHIITCHMESILWILNWNVWLNGKWAARHGCETTIHRYVISIDKSTSIES